jgi:hypothetical protein
VLSSTSIRDVKQISDSHRTTTVGQQRQVEIDSSFSVESSKEWMLLQWNPQLPCVKPTWSCSSFCDESGDGAISRMQWVHSSAILLYATTQLGTERRSTRLYFRHGWNAQTTSWSTNAGARAMQGPT